MSNTPSSRGFFGYEEELEAEIFEFQRAQYPDRRADLIAGNWRWRFVDSAERLNLRPFVWLYRKGGSVVAHQGAIPVQLKVGEARLTTGWFVETMTADSVRGSPIGPMVIKKALEDMPLNLSLGQTAQMRELQFAMGWKHVVALTKYVLVCGYRMNLRSKLPMGIAELAAFTLGLRHSLQWRAKQHRDISAFEFEMVERFSEEHDQLWERMAKTCTCAVVRDSSYMNWKYIDRPSRNVTCIAVRCQGELSGVLVISMAGPNKVYPYPRGVLVDFVAPLDGDDVILALITKGISDLKGRGAQTIICQSVSAKLNLLLEQVGFAARQLRHQFLVAVGDESPDIARQLLGAENWFLTLGDSDADSYVD